MKLLKIIEMTKRFVFRKTATEVFLKDAFSQSKEKSSDLNYVGMIALHMNDLTWSKTTSKDLAGAHVPRLVKNVDDLVIALIDVTDSANDTSAVRFWDVVDYTPLSTERVNLRNFLTTNAGTYLEVSVVYRRVADALITALKALEECAIENPTLRSPNNRKTQQLMVFTLSVLENLFSVSDQALKKH